MIKNIIVPERLGSYYVFAQRILGVDISKTHVNATQVLLKGKSVTIEKQFDIALDTHGTASYEERVVKALSLLIEQAGTYDAVYTCISSSMVVFKELRLPFTSEQKIAMVVDFEVEPLLPFSLNDAVIDFIITRTNEQEHSSQVLVAAVQKQHLAQHLNLFAQVGIEPSIVTVDLFAWYGLYSLIPAYAQLPGGVALVECGSHTTSIAYLYNGQLRFIRTLSKGTLSIAKTISQALHLQPIEAMDNILRFGLSKDTQTAYAREATPAFAAFWQEVAFTITSFSAQLEQHPITKILLLGPGSTIKNIIPFVENTTGLSVELFTSTKLQQQERFNVTFKNNFNPQNTISMGVALSPLSSSFNLRKKEFSLHNENTLLAKQLIVAACLTLIVFGLLITHSIVEIRRLHNAVQTAQQEMITQLKNQFKKIPAAAENLDAVIALANNEIKKEEKLWFSFANPNRTSLLTYLAELTNRINKQEIGFRIDKLDINENTIVMTAHVKDHKALALLEKELEESNLFARIEGLDNPDFTMRIRLAPYK